RINNKFGSMEDLEKAVSSQGLNWEDFKDNIRKSILTQRVISQEVGSHINVTHDEIEKYYNEHKKEYVRPEQVALREIVVGREEGCRAARPEEKSRHRAQARAGWRRLWRNRQAPFRRQHR